MKSNRFAAPRHQYRYFDLAASAFVVVLLVSNLVAGKITRLGPFELSGAQLLFPITYIFGDIFTEVYGYAGSRRAIWLGFSASALLALMGWAVVSLPPAPGFQFQAAYATVLGFVPRLVAASLIAYFAGEFANSYVLARLKVLTNGRMLWVRTIGSTVVGQMVDTALVMVIAFAGRESWATIVNLIFSGYIGKVLYEAAATPVTYWVVNRLKRAEGVDVYDVATNFNPFAGGESGAEFRSVGGAPQEIKQNSK